MKLRRLLLLLIALPFVARAAEPLLFEKANLVAWCIVPFDSMHRTPEERAAMLEKLGVKKFAYDYRAEHIPTWDAELDALKRHGIELTAWWFPGTLNDEAKRALALFARHGVKPQLWVSGGGAPVKDAAEQKERVEKEAARIRPIAEAAAAQGLKVALYNHGGWFGEPENEIEILAKLGLPNVGLVYNLHHGHGHIDRFPQLLQKMKPHLLALNLNGMTRGGDEHGDKILPLAQGALDLELLKMIRESGWRGLIGILNHTGEDAEARLLDNLDGLHWLVPQLDGKPAGEKPTPRSWKKPAPSPGASRGERGKPETFTIPAAKTEELTRANGWPTMDDFRKWDRSLGGPTSNRFTALTQITKQNVKDLKVAWEYHSQDGAANVQCNPIIVDGVMFAPTAGWNIVALDAANGKELWRFSPPKEGRRLEDQPARRGLLFWKGDANRSSALQSLDSADAQKKRSFGELRYDARIIFGAGNWLYALDPKTGKVLDFFGEHGRTNIPAGTSTVAATYRDVLVAAGYAGDVFGYDIRTGAMLWTFRTKPDAGEYGHETWSAIEQGANCWGGMALDESRGIAYVATGSPKPNYIGMGHTGDNLFSNCVIALDALTGKRLWHFQEIRHDVWDWDIPAPPNLVTVERPIAGGKSVRVDAVAQVTKLGNTLLLDRVTGAPLFDFRLVKVNGRVLPGDIAAPMQPMPALPQPFARQAFTLADLPASPDAQAVVLPVVQRANYGPYPSIEEAKPTLLFNIHGGAEWTGASADPRNGKLFVTSNEIPWYVTCFRDSDPEPLKPATEGEKMYQTFCAACHGADRKGIGHVPPLRGVRLRLKDDDIRGQIKNGRNGMPPQPQLTDAQLTPLLDFLLCRDRPIPPIGENAKPKWTFAGWNRLVDQEGYPGCKPPWGTLTCLDLNTGRIAWQVPFGEYAELAARGTPKTGQESFGGCMSTASGLVIAGGTRDKKIRAFDADTGAELWSHELPLHSTAPPASYEVNGKQFIVVPVTGGGKLGGPTGDSWVAFALP